MSSEIPNMHQQWLAALVKERQQKVDDRTEKLPKQDSNTEPDYSEQDLEKLDSEIQEANTRVQEIKYLALLTKCAATRAREHLTGLEARRLSLWVRLEFKEKEDAQKVVERSTSGDRPNGALMK